jgi:ubiquinone/menaquinone biosynthesis C-methylase UbiE
MADSEDMSTFRPKQALDTTYENWLIMTADGGKPLAASSLEQIPAIPAGAVIHDNGCGPGAATAAIMAAVSPDVAATIKITGTDIDKDLVEAYRTRAAASSWPAVAEVMDANALSFPDETFTHSIANAVVFNIPVNNGIDAVKEMRRTLKPGGTLIVNSIAYTCRLEPIRVASRLTRPAGTPEMRNPLGLWQDPAYLAGIVEAGGFEKKDITVQQRDVFANVGNFDLHTRLVWSFMGDPYGYGWRKGDEDTWDEAVEIVRQEFRKTEGFQLLEDGTAIVRSVANVVTATK